MALRELKPDTERPNPITSLDAAMALQFHAGRLGRGASEFIRWAAI
jgi:hypothetical protein